MPRQSRKHTVRLDLSKNRLSISMDVLYTLGKPSWIQLLISADRKTMFIRSCTAQDNDRFFVPPRVYTDSEYEYCLRKAAFAEAICRAQSWDSTGSYRLFGFLVGVGVVGFRFDDAVRLDISDE